MHMTSISDGCVSMTDGPTDGIPATEGPTDSGPTIIPEPECTYDNTKWDDECVLLRT